MRDGNSPTSGGGTSAGGPDDPTARSTGREPREPGSVHVIMSADRTRIVLSGEVDADLGPDLIDASADAEAAGLPIEVDTHHVSFMDSSGVAFLARLATRSRQPVRVIRVPPAVRFLLEVTRIGEMLEIVDGDAEFKASLPSSPPDGPPDIVA